MKRNRNLEHVFALLFLLLVAFVQTEAQLSSSASFISTLQKAPAYAVLANNAKANPHQLIVTRVWKGDLCQLSVKNNSGTSLAVKEVVVFDWKHGLPGSTPVYGEAFQKLGQIGGTLAKPEDWGTYADRLHYKIPEPEQLRTAYGMFTLQTGSDNRVLLATTSCNKFISRFSFSDTRLRISMDCENLVLQPGQTWQLEEFIAIAGPDREKLYDRLTSAIAIHHPKLKFDTIPMGWCSWYCFGPGVTAQNVADNTEWIANHLPELQYIQLDDGYQPWMGDWLDAGKAFGGDVSRVLQQIKAKHLEPAIWVAPFIASPDSKLFKEHPDWMVKDENGQPLRSDKIGFGGWRLGPWYVLDGTHPEVQKYFESLFRTMRQQWGCTYFKLDANYWGAMHGGVHYDKNATRIEAYRRGMEAIRNGAGDAFLLGCNHPIWASLGLVHGSRSSMDTDRKWKSFRDIGRENLLRGWQNGRLWWNDPDCILLYDKATADIMDAAGKKNQQPSALTENEFLFHAATVYASGGMLLSGDDLPKLSAERLAILKKLMPPTGVAARFENENFEVGVTQLKNKKVYSVFNWGDTAVKRSIQLPAGKYKLTDKFTDKELGTYETVYNIPALNAHSALLIEAEKQQ
ncbi:MAG TPA: glycoside hydrolase family 36 protein [Phnomibacter sp.]|nr:glycoside hydrolase family 36 protein [Phnomibacter sp.]